LSRNFIVSLHAYRKYLVAVVVPLAFAAPTISAQRKFDIEGKPRAITVAQVRLPARNETDAASMKSQKNFAFEVISIRPLKPKFSPYDKAPAPVGNMEPSPSGFSSTMVPGMLIQLAYGTTAIEQMPNWFANWYFINARVADEDIAAWQKQSNKHELLRLAIQSMLRERFKLLVHERHIQSLEYALVVQKHGVKFKPSVPGAALPQGFSLPSGGVRTLDVSGKSILKMHFYNATIADLLDVLEGTSPGHPVRDATGLTGHYNFTLERDPDSRPEDPIFTFPVNSLGLQLKQITTSSVAIVIDHVETPSPN